MCNYNFKRPLVKEVFDVPLKETMKLMVMISAAILLLETHPVEYHVLSLSS